MIRPADRIASRSAARPAFTIVEICSVLLLIGVLVSLLLPAVQAAREMARRTSCANNLTQVGLAMHNYHSAFKQLPAQLSGTDGSIIAGKDNDRRLSCFVGLLPFLEMSGLSGKVAAPLDRRDPVSEREMWYFNDEFGADAEEGGRQPHEGPWVAGGPEPFQSRYFPWLTDLSVLRCPSDPGIGAPSFGRTNYAICLGDGVVAADSGPRKEVNGVFVYDPELAKQTKASMRGVFVPRVAMRLSDTTDGFSNTLMLGEIATDLGDQDIRTSPTAGPGAKVLSDNPAWAHQNDLIDSERPMFWGAGGMSKVLGGNNSMRRGFRWADGMPLYTAFNAILPPNREITMRDDRDDCWGVLPPSSRHQGGTHVCFADGAVQFISDSIDAGDGFLPTVYDGSANPPGSESPYGLWGALGTRASGELKAYEFADQAE